MEDTTGRGLENPYLFIIPVNLRFCGTAPINIFLFCNINPIFVGLHYGVHIAFPFNRNPGGCMDWFALG